MIFLIVREEPHSSQFIVSLAEGLEYLFRALRGLLDDFDYLFELGHGSIAHDLVHEALTADDLGTSMSQPCQCHGDFLLVDTAYAIRDDVHTVAFLEEIERSLRDADVRFDTDNNAGKRRTERGDTGTDFGRAMDGVISTTDPRVRDCGCEWL